MWPTVTVSVFRFLHWVLDPIRWMGAGEGLKLYWTPGQALPMPGGAQLARMNIKPRVHLSVDRMQMLLLYLLMISAMLKPSMRLGRSTPDEDRSSAGGLTNGAG